MISPPANYSSGSKQTLFCAKCSKIATERLPLKKCSACKTTRYCSQECQKADWKNHKSVCKTSASEYANDLVGGERFAKVEAPRSLQSHKNSTNAPYYHKYRTSSIGPPYPARFQKLIRSLPNQHFCRAVCRNFLGDLWILLLPALLQEPTSAKSAKLFRSTDSYQNTAPLFHITPGTSSISPPRTASFAASSSGPLASS